jgi:hypothetical protein
VTESKASLADIQKSKLWLASSRKCYEISAINKRHAKKLFGLQAQILYTVLPKTLLKDTFKLHKTPHPTIPHLTPNTSTTNLNNNKKNQ